jgi:Ran GTPase-activating protein (RanGAP) involved in mRNA processing and transport
VSRTDELYAVAERLHPVFSSVLGGLLKAEGLAKELLEVEPLKDPVWVHRTALEEYAGRFPDDPDTLALPEACVCDVISARIVCKSGDELLQLVGRLQKGFKLGDDKDGGPTSSISLMRLKNEFARLNPTHFRNVSCVLRVESAEGLQGFAELQLHHADIINYDKENNSAEHYNFFRHRLGSSARTESINTTLERVLLFLMEAAGVPVLLSLLVLVFSSQTEEDLEMLPQSSYELYSLATQSAVMQRLTSLSGEKQQQHQSGTSASDKGGAGERARPARERKKAGAEWRQGTKADANVDSMFDLGLSNEEVYEVYTRAHKVLDLLRKGQFGLSELKQKYVPQSLTRLKPFIDRLLDKGTRKGFDEKLLEAGINMLRLVAVDNQQNGRREFSSVHVAETLARSGDDAALSLWLRLDCDEAGVTLIKTLESLTDSAPAMYQYKHLSFQEGLFARDLLNRVDSKRWQGWNDDETAAAFLNNAYMNNVCRIAAGELGKRLANARERWDFHEHRLSWVGKSALWQLVQENPVLLGLNLSGNGVGPGQEWGGESMTDGIGLARLLSTCPRLQSVDLGFNKLGAFDGKSRALWTKALAGNAALTALDLQSNDLGPDGVKAVAVALLSCGLIRRVNLSRNMPGRNVESLVQLVREHKSLESLLIVEDDDKHLPSKAKSMLGEAILANPAHPLAFLACDAFDLGETTSTLRLPPKRLAAEIQLLAGALRSNGTLTNLEMAGTEMADGDRQELGKALLDNPRGRLGYCDEFHLSPGASELEIDLKESAAARRGPHLLFGVLRANTSLKRATLKMVGTEHVPLLAQALAANSTLESLQLDHLLQTSGTKRAVSVTLPVQQVIGASGVASLDLSGCGELSRITCAALGAMLAGNGSITSLRLSGTKLGDEGGAILDHLGALCKEGGTLRGLDLSGVGLSDRGGRKLFEAIMSGEYSALRTLALGGNELRDPKANGLIDVLRMDDCSLTSLDISGNAMSGSVVMRALARNRSLNHLNVCGTEVDEEGMKFFGAMLLSADCSCPIKLLACDHFAVLEGTDGLDFSGGAQLPSAALTLLCGILRLNETVCSLNLAGAGVDAEAARSLETALGTNRTLTRLDLRDNPKLWMHEMGVDDGEGLEALARGLHASSSVAVVLVDAVELPVQRLKGAEATAELDLSAAAMKKGGPPLGGVSAALSAMLIERNGSVRRLDVSQNRIKRLGHGLGMCLAGNASLTELVLREAKISDEGVTALSEGLLKNAGLRLSFLDLFSNGIGVGGAEAIAKVLGANRSLTKLDLGNNSLGAAGVAALAVQLQVNSSLVSLSLVGNELEQSGAGKVASALKMNGTLTTLWLGQNRLGNEGVGAIVDALLAAGASSKLAQLDMSNNGIGAAGIKAITRLLAAAGSLTSLSIAGTKLEFTDTDALQNSAKESPDLGRPKAVRLWMGKDHKNWPPL